MPDAPSAGVGPQIENLDRCCCHSYGTRPLCSSLTRISYLHLPHPDGKKLDEVYNYGSFEQSKMFATGVAATARAPWREAALLPCQQSGKEAGWMKLRRRAICGGGLMRPRQSDQ